MCRKMPKARLTFAFIKETKATFGYLEKSVGNNYQRHHLAINT
jgi:hypothetical protein